MAQRCHVITYIISSLAIGLIMDQDSKAWTCWHGDNRITCNTSKL